MSLPKILILNDTIDLIADGYLSETFSISTQKGFNVGKLVDSEMIFTVKNNNYQFNEDHSKSLLYGVNWRQGSIKVKNRHNDTIWEGYIYDIQPDFQGSAQIIAKSIINQIIEQPIEYESADWETVGDALYNIFDAYSFTNYDSKTLQRTINVLTDNGCYVKCSINKSDNLTLQNAIVKLCEVGCCDYYPWKNNLYIQHWEENKGSIVTDIQESEILDIPQISTLMDNVVNEYSIDHYESGGTPETDSNNNNIMSKSRTLYGTREIPAFDTGPGKQVVFKDSTSAVYIGETYYKRVHLNPVDPIKKPLPIRQVILPINISSNDWVDMQSKFLLNFSDMEWTDKLLEVYGIDYRENENIQYITAQEVTA